MHYVATLGSNIEFSAGRKYLERRMDFQSGISNTKKDLILLETLDRKFRGWQKGVIPEIPYRESQLLKIL